MATMSSCGELVAVLPKLSRMGRTLAGSAEQAAMLLHLGSIEQLGMPRMSDLAAHLQLSQSTMSRRVGELRTAGLVHVIPDPDDGRSQHVGLTAAGESELRRRRCSTTERLTERLAAWSDEDVAELVDLLDRLGSTAQPAQHGQHGGVRSTRVEPIHPKPIQPEPIQPEPPHSPSRAREESTQR